MDGKILIIDDIATNRIVFKVKLGAARYHPVMADSGAEGLRLARSERPGLILLDLLLPDLPGIEVLRQLRDDPLTRDIPVIVVSASALLQDRLAALEAGADDVFIKPYDDALLMARLRNLMRSRQDFAEMTDGQDHAMFGMSDAGATFCQPGVIALVTDQPGLGTRLRRSLTGLLRDRLVLTSPASALPESGADFPAADIYLIDATGPQADRARMLLTDLRSRTASRHAGICLMAGRGAEADMLMAYDLGASAILTNDMPPDEIALRLRTVLRRKRRSDLRREQVQDGLRLAMIDPLTGLFNRRYASARLSAMAEQALTGGRSLAVMVADIDRFKSVNDRHGHAIGDLVLVEVSKRMGALLRADDLIARIGGEEFLIALPSTTLEEAKSVASRLCQNIEQRPVLVPGTDPLRITISIGVALINTASDPIPGSSAELVGSMVDMADQALLMSKKAGRNQVTLGCSAA